jgi:hypothetical protein
MQYPYSPLPPPKTSHSDTNKELASYIPTKEALLFLRKKISRHGLRGVLASSLQIILTRVIIYTTMGYNIYHHGLNIPQ